ncbi:hypothetical protein ABAC402_18860 [Asticcacaulis sp. AC402]|nr:hypothetical protein ABAC402_18860 [Asticcacaulis sp. AC402]
MIENCASFFSLPSLLKRFYYFRGYVMAGKFFKYSKTSIWHDDAEASAAVLHFEPDAPGSSPLMIATARDLSPQSGAAPTLFLNGAADTDSSPSPTFLSRPFAGAVDSKASSDFSGDALTGCLCCGGGGLGGVGAAQGTSGGIRDASQPGISEVLTYTYDGVDARYEYTGNQLIDGAIFGSRWTVTNITFSFPATGEFYNTPYYDPAYIAEQVPFNAAQQSAALYGLSLISSYTNLTFTQVTESAETHGIIRMSQTTADGAGSAEGNFPGSDASDGDIWFGQTGQPFYLTPRIGNWGMSTMIHEIGHTMGLKHGHSDYTFFDLTVGGYLDGPGQHFGTAALPAEKDGWAWSVMTYRSAPEFAVGFQGEQFNQPQTYMQADIAALQFMYGANFTSNATDTVYTFNATTGEMFINGVGQGVPEFDAVAGVGKIFRTIWDGNGTDTYDFSNFTNNQTVNLLPGEFSTFSLAQRADSRPLVAGFTAQPGNIGNALQYQGDARSLIENAITGSGNDKLIGNAAINTLTGGLGNDTYVVDSSDVVVEAADAGTDLIMAISSYSLGETVENLTLLTTSDATGNGNDLANIIIGGTGSYDVLNGLGGSDFIYGAADILPVAQTLNETGLPQHDTIANAVNLPASLFGVNSDANIVNSTTVPHTTVTGTGDGFYDVYSFVVDAAGVIGRFDIDASISLDSFVELFDAGGTRLAFDDDSDTSEGGGGSTSSGDSFLSYTFVTAGTYFIRVGKYVTNTTSAALDVGDGYTLHVSLEGNALPPGVPNPADGVDAMDGGAGDDTLMGVAGDDYLTGGAGDDSLDGGTGNNTANYFTASGAVTVSLALQGTAQNTIGAGTDTLVNFRDLAGSFFNDSLTGDNNGNLLNGQGGADTMAGGLGNDTYWILDAGDVINEAAGAGTDLVLATLDYSLAGKQVENLFLAGNDNLNGSGNGLANQIRGNEGNNVLSGGAGLDTLDGQNGNDRLDGGTGNDSLIGFDGNDTYVVDAAGDVVNENEFMTGIDLVESSITYTLGAYVENLTLTGSANINGTGHAGNNVLVGNSGNNVLTGGTGDDTYIIQNAADNVVEASNAGIDLIVSSVTYSLSGKQVENLTLIDGAGNINATGNGLANTLRGNAGNNRLDGGSNSDSITGGAGDDTLIGGSGNDTIVAGQASDGNDSVDGGDGNDLITSSGQGIYNAGGGNDYVFAGLTATSEVIDGGTGNDTIDTTSVFAEYSVNLVTGATNYGGESYVNFENAVTGEGNDTVIGTAVANAITTGAGNDSLDGGAGNDTLVGGEGDDSYVVESVGDGVTEQFDDGNDRVISTVSYTLSDNVEILILQGSADLSGTGNGQNNFISGQTGNNTLIGLGGEDVLDGGTGNDSLVGGTGNDAYVVDAIGDTVTELAAEGDDLVYADISFTLGANLENLVLTGIGGTSGTGNDLNNILEGNSGNNALTGLGGNDQLIGGAGNDTLLGGLGNDTYVVTDAGDVVTEISNQGTDEVRSTITYSLNGKQVENLTLLNGSAINATGNSFNNVLTGNDSNNVLNGSSGNDTLSGFGGNDSLIGGTGADLMSGGLGDDTFVIDDALDLVSETPGDGIDTVQSSLTWTLTDPFENLVLTGSAVIDGTGNASNNVLTGNSGNNILTGGLGDDTYFIQNTGDNVVEDSDAGTDAIISSVTYSLAGRQVEILTLTGAVALNATGNGLANTLTGNDGVNTLDGGAGHDQLDGGLGADALIGGTGNDSYYVDNAGDTVTEDAAAGTDLVESSITYGLAANVDNLTLTGSAAINATGNALNNVLTGNTGNNVLTGGLGNDSYYVQNTGDNVVELSGQGADVIFSTVSYSLNARYAETIILTGSADVNATGNSLANTLTGNDGINTINGKGGADILTGGLGADIFLFEAGSGGDTITDFNAVQNDSINVNAYTAGVANAGLVTQSGLNVLISLGGGNVITVSGAVVADVLAQMVW